MSKESWNQVMISIIIPVYNTGKYLQECVNSVLQQSYTNIEIILVDDGSTDESGCLCDKYHEQDSRVKVIHKKNGGLSEARNKGIEKATGQYLMFIDSDDVVNREMISKLYNNIIKFQADISICSMWWKVNEAEQEVEQNQTIITRLYEGAEIKKLLYGNDCITPVETVVAWNKLYKAELFDEIRYPVGRFHEDEFVIHHLLAKSKRVVYTNEKLYYYMQREGSITNKFSVKRICDVVDAYTERIQFWDKIEKKDDGFLLQVTVSWLGALKSAYEGLNANNKEHRKARKYIRTKIQKNRKLLKHSKIYGKKFYFLALMWGYAPRIENKLERILKL